MTALAALEIVVAVQILAFAFWQEPSAGAVTLGALAYVVRGNHVAVQQKLVHLVYVCLQVGFSGLIPKPGDTTSNTFDLRFNCVLVALGLLCLV
jgi:hypothetical protein